jgi:urease accessory protein
LVVNLASPTAGVFDDDSVDIDILVESGAHLVLTTPSATRVYRSRNGNAAQWRQSYRVSPGASFEYFPEPLIPHAGARLCQQTSLRVDNGGRLMYFEWLAPGRTAGGENFKFAEMQWDLDLWCGERLAARERYALRSDDQSLEALLLFSPEAHYVGCFVHGFTPDADAIHAMTNEDIYAGCGPLAHDAFVIKLLCRNGLVARRAIQTLRQSLYRALDKKMPWTGRF